MSVVVVLHRPQDLVNIAGVVRAKCQPYLHHGQPVRRTERIVDLFLRAHQP